MSSSEERYPITKLIRKSRTGGLYLAEDKVLNREVTIRRFFTSTGDKYHKEAEDTFQKLAQKLSVLKHPNLLDVYDAGIDEDGPFVISQPLKGEVLHEILLRNETFSEYRTYDIARQALSALGELHERGFIHGAITTRSVQVIKEDDDEPQFLLHDSGLYHLSVLMRNTPSKDIGEIISTAPEILEGANIDARSDLYSLGHLCFLCITAGHPFSSLSVDEVIQHAKNNSMPPLDTFTDISKDFSNWIQTLMDGNPEKRFQSTEQALQALPKIHKPVTVADIQKAQQSKQTMTRTFNMPAEETEDPPPQLLLHQSAQTGQQVAPAPVANATATDVNSQISSIQQQSSQKQKRGYLYTTIALCATLALITGMIFMLNKRKNKDETATKTQPQDQNPQDQNTNTDKTLARSSSPLSAKAQASTSNRTRKNTSHVPTNHTHFTRLGFSKNIINEWVLNEQTIVENHVWTQNAGEARLILEPQFTEKALIFRTDQYVTIASNLAKKIPRGGFSVEAFVKIDAGSGGILSYILEEGKEKRGFMLCYEKRKAVFKIADQTKFITIRDNKPISTKAFTHIVGTFDGNEMKLFINGVLTGTKTYRKKIVFSSKTTPFLIGNQIHEDKHSLMSGLIRLTATYNKALTAGQIKKLYQARTKDYR